MEKFQAWVQQLDFTQLWEMLIVVAASLLCITFHETCHGLVAYWMGDPTAKKQGRLSLNPLRHIDIMGLVMMAVCHFGWAKPVPINPSYFKNRRVGIALVSLAGPASNFVLALLALFLYYPLRLTSSPILTAIALMLYMTAVMSIGLGVFNLIPVPPLDGSKILLAFLPAKYEYKFAQYEQYIQFILLILLFVGVLDRPINFFINVVYHVLSSIVLLVF